MPRNNSGPDNKSERHTLDFLTSPFFRFFIFPIGSAVLGVAVKYVTRNDQYATFKKEDLAVGLDLIRVALLMYIVLTTDWALALLSTNEELAQLAGNPVNTAQRELLQDQAQQLTYQVASAGWVIALMFLGLWGVSTLVRKWGWQSDTELRPVIGIGIPLVLGISALIMVMAEAAK